jgi:hypothetical protein
MMSDIGMWMCVFMLHSHLFILATVTFSFLLLGPTSLVGGDLNTPYYYYHVWSE